MPYKAIYNGDVVGPDDVPEKTRVECPDCGGEMHIVKGHPHDSAGYITRHFSHKKGNGGGGGGNNGGGSCGESDEHWRMKYVAKDKLRYIFEDNCLKCETEYELQNTVSDRDHREADALVLFDDPDEQLGQGVAVEVQYKNKGKDKRAVEKDYIENNISTVWVTPDDYSKHKLLLGEADIRDRAARAVWPKHVPDRRSWWAPEHSPEHLRWENNGVDRFQIGRLDVMSDRYSRDVSVPAAFPEPILDELRYRESDWSALFADYAADHFRAQAAIPRTDSRTRVRAVVAERWLDSERYNMATWADLFYRPTHRRYTKQQPTLPIIDVQLPPEYAEKHRETLLHAWQRGSGEYDFDLCYELSDNNAPRRCADCGGGADLYLFQENIISEYRCREHIPTSM